VKDRHPFVSRLYELAARDDRAALAELRRGFQNPIATMPYVVPFLRREATRREQDALALVASLFALHPEHGDASLATALARIARDSDSVGLRFRALLNADAEDLPIHLRHAVTLARSHDIPLDYDDLLRTLLWWGSESKDRQRAWARDFWGHAETTEETSS
jgi:CRISPR system Cascade subunit CasB